tara:strand:- start:7638 stop:10064 length:2427 start_codon:yes stop_codon:yes gene_type:complete
MANKYSRYQLQPFPSLYVDDKKTDIAQLLAQRYDQNKTSKDLIDRTLSQMELLDGDKEHGERVKGKVKGLLNDHIKKGDWENSSLVVQDAAQAVETDQGLIAANQSWKNRAAEIQAIREANLNGIPMIDFGAESRKTHQSYVYDEQLGTYSTNIYEPLSQAKLDYRSRKENMIGKIPADQRGNWTGVNRSKTNKIANLLVEQYIADTKEGIQEYRKLVEVDLPQSLPLEDRMKMAKNQIKEDFKLAAQQQEFDKVTASKGDDGRNSGNGYLPKGMTIKSNVTSPVSTQFDKLDDKIRGIQEENMLLLDHLATEKDPKKRDIYQTNIDENNALLNDNLKIVAGENGVEGQRALDKYNRIEKRFSKYGTDGQRLLAATQYLTYNTYAQDTDWDLVASRTWQGAGAGGVLMAGYGAAGGTVVLPGGGTVVGAAGLGAVGAIGGGVTGFVEGTGEAMFGDLRNVRDVGRRQEPLLSSYLGDSERDQLKEEIWGDEDLEDMKVDHINKLLGTTFKQDDIEELSKMTNAYYTFMTKDGSDGKNGVRLTGDQLFEKTLEKQFVINQPTVGFDMTDDGKKLRTATADYIRKDLDLSSAGITSNGMLNPEKITEWVEDNGGATKLQLEGVRLPDLVSNTPLKLTFGFEGDGTGGTSRDFYVTDQTVMQPGGWVYDMLDKNMGLGQNAYDESLRQQYNAAGYSNVTVDNYVNDMAYKNYAYGGGGSDEDLAKQVSVMQDEVIMGILLNPNAQLPQYPVNEQGVRTVAGQNGQQIPFQNQDGGFNQAAWITLQSKPEKLASLRKQVLGMSLPEFTGTNF